MKEHDSLKPVDFLRSRGVVWDREPTPLELIDKARQFMPTTISEPLTLAWTERNPLQKLNLVHSVTEEVLKHICRIMNAVHKSRYRPGLDEDKSFTSVEQMLNTSVEKDGKLSFGVYVGHVRRYAELFRDYPVVPEIGSIGTTRIGQDGVRFIAAIKHAEHARQNMQIPGAYGVERYVQERLGSGTLAASCELIKAFDAFVVTRNAVQHGESWWLNADAEWADLILRYAAPTFEAVLASEPILGFLLRYESIEVPATAAAVREVPDIRRPHIRPELRPINRPSRLLATQPTLFEPGAHQQIARRDESDPCTLWYIGPAVEYPTPVKGQKALFAEYSNRCINQVYRDGKLDRASLKSFVSDYVMKKPEEAEKNAWSVLRGVFIVETGAEPSAEHLAALARAVHGDEPISDATRSLREDCALARERIKQHVFAIVNQYPGGLQDIVSRSDLDEAIVKHMLDALVRDKLIVRSRVTNLEIYVPRVVEASEIFRNVCDWLTKGLESASTAPLQAPDLVRQLVELLKATARFVGDAGHMAEHEVNDYIEALVARYGDYLYSQQGAAIATTREIVSGIDDTSSSDTPANSITIDGQTFTVQYLVPFLRAFDKAFGAPGSAFQRALTAENPVRAGRTRYLASRKPIHANDSRFRYEVKCGEGDHAYYFESHIPVQNTLFALQRYLMQHCGMQVSLGGEVGADQALATPVVAPSDSPVTKDSSEPLLRVYFTRDEIDDTVEGYGVEEFLKETVRKLASREFIGDQLPVLVSRTRCLIAEAPFHADGERFRRPVEVEGYFVETQWGLSEAIEVVREAARFLGVECSTDEEEAREHSSATARASTTRIWKIAPDSDGLAWDDWQRDEVASIGWPELGDLSDCTTEAEFELRARQCGLGKSKNEGVWQVWKFRNEIRVGDTIVANEGTHTVLGFGRVVDNYSYDENYRVGNGKHSHPHRLGVKWEDRKPREVSEPGWRKTLVLLTPERLAELRNRPEIEDTESVDLAVSGSAAQVVREVPALHEVPGYTCAQAKELELIGYLRELFQQKTTHVFARRLNAAAGQTRLQTLFAEFFERWPDRDVVWARRFKAEGFLAERTGIPSTEVEARLAGSSPETLLKTLFTLPAAS